MAKALYTLIRVDGATNHQFDVKEVEIILGRGQFLQISEKKISRNHALLTYEGLGKLRLKSTHPNPCFVALTWKSKKLLLKQGGSVSLNTGDQFSLLNKEYTYRVKMKNGIIPEKITTEELGDNTACGVSTPPVVCKEIKKDPLNSTSEKKLKRKLPSWMSPGGLVKTQQIIQTPDSEDSSIKQQRVEFSQNGDINSTDTCSKLKLYATSSDEDSIPTHVFRKSSQNTAVSPSSGSRSLDNNSDDESSETIENVNKDLIKKDDSMKIETTTENNELNSSVHANESQSYTEVNMLSSSPQASNGNINSHTAKRTPCMYGLSCYRKNTNHFRMFSHPNDPDYYDISSQDSNVSDDNDKPECEYGLNCYRKNPIHRRDYKHTQRKNAKRASKNKGEEDVDEYDLDDSFIDSSEEEEMVTDEEPDWQPSKDRENDEEMESDIEDLIMDAKNFTKNKKLWQK